MKALLNLVLTANGSPSEVKARINDQVQAIGQLADQAPLVAPVRDFLAKKLDGVSEDETLSVSATIAIIVTDPPAILVQKRADEKEAHEKEVRGVTARLTDAEKKVAELTEALEAAKKAAAPATPAPAK